MQDVFRECLSDLDVPLAMRAWQVAFPHLPGFRNAEECLVVLHMARTSAKSSGREQRFYSHRWLLERGYPSQLPDWMKPSAERLYPVKVGAVGVATKTRTALACAVQDAMVYAVEECRADGVSLYSPLVKERMLELRGRVLRS